MEPSTPREGGTAPATSTESSPTPPPNQHTPPVTCPTSVTKHLQSLKKLTLDCSDAELRSYVARAIVATPLSPYLNPRNAAVSRLPPLDMAGPEAASPATSEGAPSFTARASTPVRQQATKIHEQKWSMLHFWEYLLVLEHRTPIWVAFKA